MDFIYEGTVLKDRSLELPLKVWKLTMEDLEDILAVQEQVYRHQLKDKVLQPLSKEEYRFILEGNGLMIGAFAAEELIAFRALVAPPIDDEHLGKDLGLADSELPKVIYQEISCVLPAYRGNGLQKKLAALIMGELGKQKHSYRYICSTVKPFNIPSLKDKFAQGMQIGALKEKYGGQLRYIFVKDLGDREAGVVTSEAPVKSVSESSWEEIVSIPMEDITAQKEQLKQGWRGIQMEETQGKMWVHYGR